MQPQAAVVPEIEDPRLGQSFAEPAPPPIVRDLPPRPAPPVAEPLLEREVEHGRFAGRHAAPEIAPAPRMVAGDLVQQRARSSTPAPRRRQAKTGRASPGRFSSMPLHQQLAAQQRRRGRAILAVAALTLLLVGGWFGLRSVDAGGLGPMIERIAAFLPLTDASRTAADSSFDHPEAGERLTPDEALADLEARIRQQNGDALAPAQTTADPATTRLDGPPVPVFKPLSGQSRSIAISQGAASPSDQAQLAGTAGDGDEPTIFEQFWRYINPG
jgi:hypothetical protein